MPKTLTMDEIKELVEEQVRNVLSDADEIDDLPGDLDKIVGEYFEQKADEWGAREEFDGEPAERQNDPSKALKKAINQAAVPADSDDHDPGAYKTIRDKATASGEPGTLFAKCAPEYARKVWNQGQVDARDLADKDGVIGEIHKNFMNATDIEAGAGVVPTPIAQDWIDFLREQAVVRQSGALQAEMPAGGLKVPRISQGSTTYWVGEGEGAPSSELEIELKRLDAKKLAGAVPLSNDLLRRAPRMTEALVRSDMRDDAATTEDAGFLFGDGSGGEPQGVWHQMTSDNKVTPTDDGGSYDLDTVLYDLLRLQFLPTKSNAELRQPCWYMNPRDTKWLAHLRGQDVMPFMGQLADGELLGAPVYESNNVPRTGDFSGDNDNDETRIIFGDASRILIGDTLNLRVVQFEEAMRYNGQLQAIKQQDIRGIGLFHEADMLLRRTDVHAGLDECDWSAGFETS